MFLHPWDRGGGSGKDGGLFGSVAKMAFVCSQNVGYIWFLVDGLDCNGIIIKRSDHDWIKVEEG